MSSDTERTGARHAKPLAIALGLIVAYAVVEVVAALTTGSLSLLSDAGHMGTDALGLGMALAAVLTARGVVRQGAADLRALPLGDHGGCSELGPSLAGRRLRDIRGGAPALGGAGPGRGPDAGGRDRRFGGEPRCSPNPARRLRGEHECRRRLCRGDRRLPGLGWASSSPHSSTSEPAGPMRTLWSRSPSPFGSLSGRWHWAARPWRSWSRPRRFGWTWPRCATTWQPSME